MSVLASLARAFERMEDAPPFGYSAEKIGFLILLKEDGGVADLPIDLREGKGKKKTPTIMLAPQPAKRTSSIAPNFLWDKTSYVLGITAGEGGRTAEEHVAFVARHVRTLSNADDVGLRALVRFLEAWRPKDFDQLGWPSEMKDQNVVFSLEADWPKRIRIHDRPAARALWARLGAADDKTAAACLVTGEHGPVARLHPAIKGVWGAQSSGASIVSFNLDAFTSYDHEQGDNAPVSEVAAFAYTTMLNRFLEKGSRHRMRIGDASTVYWADGSNAASLAETEGLFAALLGAEGSDETVAAKKIAAILDAPRWGKPVDSMTAELPPGVPFHVLALSPNGGRLSVRFFIEDDFRAIAERYLRHIERMRIEPSPRDQAWSIWRLLIETASQRKSDNVPAQLAGDWLRAILTGAPYPLTMLSTVLMRLRTDRDVNAPRAALLKSLLIRNFRMEVPVALDPNNDDPGYLLGRLFATLEYTQTQAIGGNINATIRDQYYGTASATPRRIFPLLQRRAIHHLVKLRKKKPGLAIYLDRVIGEICELSDAEAMFPSTLNPKRQALFAIGYYHQHNYFYRVRDDASASPTE